MEPLTHWSRVTHICASKLTIFGSDNGLSPIWRQAIIWTNAGILLIGPLGTNFSEILIGVQTFSFKKLHLKMSSAKSRPFCLGLNVLSHNNDTSRSYPILWFFYSANAQASKKFCASSTILCPPPRTSCTHQVKSSLYLSIPRVSPSFHNRYMSFGIFHVAEDTNKLAYENFCATKYLCISGMTTQTTF